MSERAPDELRTLTLEPGWAPRAEGSCLIATGDTRVLCTASVQESVPPFLKDSGRGWVTAEYAMLPRSTSERMFRESSRGKVGGRTHEIQRLIGRSMRAVVDMNALGERSIMIDCDVIQADGGTRTASITGAFIALVDAMEWMKRGGLIQAVPVTQCLAAVSVGVVRGEVLLDLCYDEDSRADVDMNVVMTEAGHFVEVQGTAEQEAFTRDEMDHMLSLAEKGIRELIALQKEAIGALLQV